MPARTDVLRLRRLDCDGVITDGQTPLHLLSLIWFLGRWSDSAFRVTTWEPLPQLPPPPKAKKKKTKATTKAPKSRPRRKA